MLVVDSELFDFNRTAPSDGVDDTLDEALGPYINVRENEGDMLWNAAAFLRNRWTGMAAERREKKSEAVYDVQGP